MNTVEEYHQALQQILVLISETSTVAEKNDIRDKLVKFMADLPNGPEFTLIYDTASKAHGDLGKQVTSTVLKQIQDRSSDLSYQIGIVRAITVKASADAQTLSLKRIQIVADAVKDSVDAINRAWQAIDANNLAAAGPALQQALDLLTQLPSAVSRSEQPV